MASGNSFPPYFLLLCVKYRWKISAVPLGIDDSATAQRQQYFSQGESHPATVDIQVVLTIPVFLKEIINVKCSIKYLLPRFRNKNGCGKSKLLGTQRSVGQSELKMLYHKTYLLLIPIHK